MATRSFCSSWPTLPRRRLSRDRWFAYAPLVGLTRLLHFLSQQTGYEPGELMIHATVANAEVGAFSHALLKELIAEVRTELKNKQEVI